MKYPADKKGECIVDLKSTIRDVPDFPKEGIIFKDVTTLLKDKKAFRQAVDELCRSYENSQIDQVVCVEARGFIFGAPVAYHLGAGMVPVRKPGKLPARTYQVTYDLEYGTDTLEIHRDAVKEGDKVLIVDDLLATGGTTKATIDLVEKLGGEIVDIAFLIELTFLNGRDKLNGYPITSIIKY
jgi:adenine phosphoribosyltransferase